MSTDTFELVGEDDNDVAGHINNHGTFCFAQPVFNENANNLLFLQIQILATTLVELTPPSRPDQGAQHQVKRATKSFPVPIVLTSALATGNSLIIGFHKQFLSVKSYIILRHLEFNQTPQEKSYEPYEKTHWRLQAVLRKLWERFFYSIKTGFPQEEAHWGEAIPMPLQNLFEEVSLQG